MPRVHSTVLDDPSLTSVRYLSTAGRFYNCQVTVHLSEAPKLWQELCCDNVFPCRGRVDTLCCSGFFPVAVNFLRRVPVVGTVLSIPPLGPYLDSLAGEQYKQMI